MTTSQVFSEPSFYSPFSFDKQIIFNNNWLSNTNKEIV